MSADFGFSSCTYRCREDDMVPSPEDVLDYLGAQQRHWCITYEDWKRLGVGS